MTALTAPRITHNRGGTRRLVLALAAATTVFQGGIVCVNSAGYAVPGATATGLVAMGRAADTVVNAGLAGAVSVELEAGTFYFANQGNDAVTRAEIGRVCWLVDDQTVAKSDGNGARSLAGIVIDLDADGVWVTIGPGVVQPPVGAQRAFLPLAVASLVGADAKVYRVVAPIAGSLARIRTVTDGALATGNATLTAKINAAAVTDGVVTIAQAGSAAGDKDEAVPTAANSFAAGDVISLTVGGTNTTGVGAMATLEIIF